MAAATDYLPLRMSIDAQHAVVVEEAQQRQRRERADGIERHGPDRRGHGEQVAIGEDLVVSAFIDHVSDGCRFGSRLVEQFWRRAVESQDLRKQQVVFAP